MILKADRIADLLENPTKSPDPLSITPLPDLEELRGSGSASIDLRLGTWFLTLSQSRSALLAISRRTAIRKEGATEEVIGETRLTKKYYVPFGKSFILHPGCFVLAATMEWMRIPKDLAGYVTSKSSWGRRGLVIATAVGIHPGFSGCLTLEVTNLGEIPVELIPGMQICQLFLHRVESESENIDQSPFVGKRRPTLGKVSPDPIAEKLAQAGVF